MVGYKIERIAPAKKTERSFLFAELVYNKKIADK